MVTQIKDFTEMPAILSVWPGLGEAFGVSRATAYQMAKKPGFPALRVSQRKIVIPKDKLLQYIEQQAEVGLS